jgi:hypothetical protein
MQMYPKMVMIERFFNGSPSMLRYLMVGLPSFIILMSRNKKINSQTADKIVIT